MCLCGREKTYSYISTFFSLFALGNDSKDNEKASKGLAKQENKEISIIARELKEVMFEEVYKKELDRMFEDLPFLINNKMCK